LTQTQKESTHIIVKLMYSLLLSESKMFEIRRCTASTSLIKPD